MKKAQENSSKLLLTDLKRGETYIERLEEETLEQESPVIILANVHQKVLWVYLIGYYEIEQKGRDLLLSAEHTEDALTELLESIPLEDYQLEGRGFYNKHGFYDEALIPYTIFPDEYTVENEYVGNITFKPIS